MKNIWTAFLLACLVAVSVQAQETQTPPITDEAQIDAAVSAQQPTDQVSPEENQAKPETAKPETAKPGKVSYNPKVRRDPTLSQDDELLLEQQRKIQAAALKKYQDCLAAKKAAEEEQERLEREYQLCLLKHPEAAVVNKIWINGIIGREVLIGDKIYGVGSTYLKAKIIAIKPETESVVFSYKGVTFTKKLGAKGRKTLCKSSKISREFNCELTNK